MTNELKIRELRSVPAGEIRTVRSDNGTTISGTAIVYSSDSCNLGGFIERIAPGAARASVAANDIMLLYSHDSDKLLARTSSGTLTLTEDAKGVHFSASLPNNSWGNDVAVSMERRDLTAMSFGFYVTGQDWADIPGSAELLRTVTALDLFEISVVGSPAYPATCAKINRSLFPDGIPAEIRAHVPDAVADILAPTVEKRDDSDNCDCTCEPCIADNCSDCSDPDCDDPNCGDCDRQSRSTNSKLLLRARLALQTT